MVEYIEREALKDKLHKRLLNGNILGWLCGIINEQPAADVAPVVRCKDCKYSFVLGESDLQKESPYKYYRKDVLMCGCEEHFGDYPESVDAMFFCGYGERKDGDG